MDSALLSENWNTLAKVYILVELPKMTNEDVYKILGVYSSFESASSRLGDDASSFMPLNNNVEAIRILELPLLS